MSRALYSGAPGGARLVTFCAVAMLPTGAPALNREEALEMLEFKDALLELQRLRARIELDR
jgi:hypothetical protein